MSTAFVERELRHLNRNKATGTNSLPPNLLKDCSRFLAPPLAHILNLSLNTSTVPSMWKLAKLSPTFKSGNSEHVKNYQPISVLPVLSKILEKAVHQQLYNFLESNNLLYDCQFGFRKARSTKLATTLFCDKIQKEMDKGRLVGSIFLDLSKVFDTIGHGILLEKLICYGVCRPELAWFTDYLFNRSQLVEINNITSDKRSITSGVPQGSIIGPLMFIIFFNNLQDSISYCDIFQCADTVILFADKNITKIENPLNKDMSSIGNHCKVKELLLNLKKGKTEVMLFGTAQCLKLHGRSLHIVYNSEVINFVTEYVYLGNLVNNHMTLASTFEQAYKKASCRLGLLHNVRRYLTAKPAKMIFELIIMPILTYSSKTKTSFNNTQLQKFSSLERRATKVFGYD